MGFLGKMKLFRKREPTGDVDRMDKNIMQMVTTYGESFYSWNGKLYENDIVRACLRPKVKAANMCVRTHQDLRSIRMQT